MLAVLKAISYTIEIRGSTDAKSELRTSFSFCLTPISFSTPLHYMPVPQSMRVYAFGSNNSGQLGIGHTDDTSMPQVCRINEGKPGEPSDIPKRILASGNTSIILFQSGLVYRAGVSCSKFTESPSKVTQATPEFRKTALTKYRKAKLCSATWEASITVTYEDEVFVYGRGSKGELGLGSDVDATDDDDVKIAQFPPKGTSIVDITSSVGHTIAVLSNGEVYGWGNGRKGQLGEPFNVSWAPRKIEGLEFSVARAVCGREFTFLVGEPTVGQHAILGSDKRGVKSQAPQYVPQWQDIGASWGSIFVLGKDRKICSWGRDDRGQLASWDVPSIESVAVGSEHVVALTADGKVLCWGWGEHGNCGEAADEAGNTASSWNEIKVTCSDNLAYVVGVGAGCATSFFWTR